MASVNWRTHQGSAMKLSVMMASTRSLSLMESLSWSWTWSPGLQSRAGRQTLQHRCGSATSASAMVPLTSSHSQSYKYKSGAISRQSLHLDHSKEGKPDFCSKAFSQTLVCFLHISLLFFSFSDL